MSKEKKVAILGFAPSSLSLAPYNDDEWEIWVLNEYFTMIPNHKAKNITRWFELHQRETVLNSHRSKDYLSKLKESEIPIMMVKKFDDIPMSVEYPLEKIIKSLKTDYFTNSISYMIAQAIYEGYTHISLYGIDMAQSEEYQKERPSVEYFVGYARAKGIEVYIPKESDICKAPYYYGFQEQVASKVVNILDPKIKDLTDRITNDDICFDEMIEHMDYHLKRYLFEYKPTVEQLRLSQQKIINLNNKLKGKDINSDESKSIVEEIKSVENVNVPVFEIDKLIDAIWESIQRLKGAKKERLFLAGAEETSKHLRMILCPFD